jgi:hypothetical protein
MEKPLHTQVNFTLELLRHMACQSDQRHLP